MLRRLILAALLALAPCAASAQFATIGATPPVSDNSDRLATTAWVNQFFALGLPLASGKIFIGSAGGQAAQQTMSGDCTLSASGVITCTKSAGGFTVNGALAVTGTASFGVATGTAPFTVASTTNVPNLNASSLNGATFAAPGAIGSTTPATSLSVSGLSIFTGTFTSPSSGQAEVAGSATNGGLFGGKGSVNDIEFLNGGGSAICATPTGTASLNCFQISAGTYVGGALSGTFTGSPTFSSGTYTFSGTVNHTGPFQINGNAQTFPAAAATLTQTIASGATAMGTGAISSATCATVVTATATGTATTDVLTASFNGDPTAVTGYVPLTAGMLTIIAYPTANTANFKVCNNTSSSITPGAITLNWRVVR